MIADQMLFVVSLQELTKLHLLHITFIQYMWAKITEEFWIIFRFSWLHWFHAVALLNMTII